MKKIPIILAVSIKIKEEEATGSQTHRFSRSVIVLFIWFTNISYMKTFQSEPPY